MELIQDKNSRKGLIGTILFHLLLLLLFLQFGMTYQDPPPANEGAMMINFGDAGGGSPSEENTEVTEAAASSSSNNSESTESSSASADENVQTTTNETVEMNASPNNSNNETTETQETSEPLNEALTNAWNNNSNNENSNSNANDNSNNSNSTGNTNGSNTGPANGIGYSLGGRGKVSFKKPDNPTQEDGTVVVDIVVDKYGNVIKANPGARGSTTTNPILYKQAKEAALKAKFTKKLEAVTDQKGTMTFVFILN